MNSALTLVTVLLALLVLLLLVLLFLYFLTQQDLRNLNTKLQAMEKPLPASSHQRDPDSVRRERAAALDQLALLEASFSAQPREVLSPEELKVFEDARRVIKASNAELKRQAAWAGLPFDHEWAEVQERMPRTNALYRRAVEAAIQEAEGTA